MISVVDQLSLILGLPWLQITPRRAEKLLTKSIITGSNLIVSIISRLGGQPYL